MRTDWTISACCHAVVLGVALVSFSPARLPATHVESIPVNIVTDTDKSQVTRGQPNAPKEAKNPFAEKIDTPSPVANPNAKIAPKEVTASTDASQPPPPEPKQTAKAKPEPKRDLIAEALKKDAAAKKAEQKKTDAKKADAKVPTPPKRPPQPNQDQRKFDPREMQALLDKRTPLRKEARGDTISDVPTVGVPRPKDAAAQLSQNELDALRARLTQLWNPPEAKNPEEILVTIRFRLKPDGTLDGYPLVKTSGRSTLFMVSRERAVNAIMRGQPFKMLRPDNYEAWRDLEVTFDPRDLVPG